MEFMWDQTEAKNALNELIDITAEFGRDIVGALFDDEGTETAQTTTVDEPEEEDAEEGTGKGENMWDLLFRQIDEVLNENGKGPDEDKEGRDVQ